MLASKISPPRRPKVAALLSHVAPAAGLRCRVLHDQVNQRLKLFGAHPAHLAELPALRELTGLGKVTAYARGGQRSQWEALGFRQEGTIRGFFRDRSDAAIWAAYPQPERGREQQKHLHEACLSVAQSKDLLTEIRLPEGYASERVSLMQAPEVAALMRSVFPVYPTPLSDEHLADLIASGGSLFRCVRNAERQMVAVASAELDLARQNAEMTDCATRLDQRGRGLMAFILSQLEKDLQREHQVVDLYSLARAQETAINCVFKKLGYDYEGRLVNNCRMPSGWESMHIWCKHSSGC